MSMDEIQRLKEEILKEYPRLNEDSSFKFQCHPGVPCFNLCCRDVNIFLTPYDIIRLKQRLGMTSEELIKKHTITPFDKNLKYPVLMLQMEDNDEKTCPFVSEKGCTVYEDRPWACRMYPLGLASPSAGSDELDKEFYFLLRESTCKGFGEDHDQTVGDWLTDQGIREYNEMGEEFKDITMNEFFQQAKEINPKKLDMFFNVCYNIDHFRKFIFESSFFDKFEVDEEKQKAMREDDVALLRFGYQWLRFALFGETTMTIKNEVAEQKKAELEEKAEMERKARERGELVRKPKP